MSATFPSHMDERGRLIVAEKHTVEFPLYITELRRFWAQYHARLERSHFERALANIESARGVFNALPRFGHCAHVVEFFYGWGTVLVCFATDTHVPCPVTLVCEGLETHDESALRCAMWKFFDQLDRALFP